MQRFYIRSAILVCYARVAQSLGLDARALAREIGMPLRLLESPDHLVRARLVYRLLEAAAERSHCADFGLRVARERLNFAYLGPLGALARDEPDIRAVLCRFASDMPLQTTSVTLRLTETAGLGLVGVDIAMDGEVRVRQATECVMGGQIYLLKYLLGADWRPAEVQFMHARLSQDVPYAAAFGCPVVFGAASNLMVLPARDLDRPNRMAEGGLKAYTSVLTAGLLPEPGHVTSEAQLTAHIRRLMPLGQCSAEVLAGELGIDRRTLHRHLAQTGTTFSQVVDRTRTELADQYLQAGALRLAEIADLLGFSSAAGFSRWFSRGHGVAPSTWRSTVG